MEFLADYKADVQVDIQGLEKLDEAERKIKELDGKVIKPKLELDSSGIKKVGEDIKSAVSQGVSGGFGSALGGANGVLGEYKRKVASSLRNEEKALAAGEQKHLSNYFKQQAIADARAATKYIANEYKKIGASSPEKATKLLQDANRINKNLKDSSEAKQGAIAAKQIQKYYDDKIKAEQVASAKAEREQAKITQQAYKAREKEIQDTFKSYDNAQIKAAKESQNRINSYLNAARGMGSSTEAQALRAKADEQKANVDKILNDSKISDSAKSVIGDIQKTQAASNDAKDFIQQQKDSYKEATNNSNLYAKSLKDVYGSYQKLQTAAVKARDGSQEQAYLANQAKILRDQYDAQKLTDDYDALSNIQKQNIKYMEGAGELQIKTAATQKDATLQAQVSNQQYKDIVSSQKQLNALKFEQSKINDTNSDDYKAYQQAIENTAATQSMLLSKHGQLDDYEKARLDSLNQEAEFRKQNYDLANRLDPRDAVIGGNSFEASLKNNSRMLKKYGDEIDSVREKYQNATTKSELADADKDARLLFSQAAADGNLGMTVFDQIKTSFKNIGQSFVGQFLSGYAVMRAVTGTARAMYSNVAGMDAAMTELYKVTDNSDREYREYSKGVQQTSMEIGATQTSLVKATATFARLGYNLTDSANLGKNATLFSNVGDEGMTSEEAATDMVAIMKGFNLQAEDSLHIVDSLNKVGKLVA